MFSKSFWRDSVERAVKTAAQFALVGGLADVSNLMALSWRDVLAAAGAGFVVSLATSLASLPFGRHDSPSMLSDDFSGPPA